MKFCFPSHSFAHRFIRWHFFEFVFFFIIFFRFVSILFIFSLLIFVCGVFSVFHFSSRFHCQFLQVVSKWAHYSEFVNCRNPCELHAIMIYNWKNRRFKHCYGKMNATKIVKMCMLNIGWMDCWWVGWLAAWLDGWCVCVLWLLQFKFYPHRFWYFEM